MAQGRKTGGRKAGVPNKATAGVRALAGAHGPTAISTLALIMNSAEAPHAARVAASKELLDRWVGRSKESVEIMGEDGGPVLVKFVDAA